STAARLRFDLHDGLEVVCRGRIEVYAPRGQYQLIVDQVEPRGVGALELALRQLHERLSKEGLFDAARKRPLPKLVRRVAVVTSPTGAAIHDFLQVLCRRWQGIEVLVVPTRVQGEGVAAEIAAAIAKVNRLSRTPDCLVVTRGGGSLEDLWAFNEEVVVRAIHASQVPVVSAVGHEIDVTLSDLVADLRALTPSEAAERIAPAADDLLLRLEQGRRRMVAAMRGRVAAERARLDGVARQPAFRRPFDRLLDLSRELDDLADSLARAASRRTEASRQQLAALAGRLESLSPLAVLGRGYSIAQRAAGGPAIRDAAELSPGERITTRFSEGRAFSLVERVEPNGSLTGERRAQTS
ncbi:MAG: exodeoxyribonuclease VII large subunit, partial [Planctomycetota bacterium]